MTTKDEPTPALVAFWQALDISHVKRTIRFLLSFIAITFGQPAYSPFCSTVASTIGFALLFYELTKFKGKARFLIGTGFFFLVQCVELFWFTYHPVVAARGTFILLSAMMGLQFGLLCLMSTKKILSSRFLFLLIPACWTLLEWSRIYWCSGFYFDLVGMSLASNLITLQTASLFGVLGMSFWVMLTNVAVVRAFLTLKTWPVIFAIIVACLPYLYGSLHLKVHTARQAAYDSVNPPLNALIVHSKKVPEEFKPKPRPRLTPQERAFTAWQELVTAIAPYYGKEPLDLMLMPEGVVPYGSSSALFTPQEMNSLFLSTLQTPYPPTNEPLISSEDVGLNIAKLYKCPLIIGLEGIKRVAFSDRPLYYNSAFFFSNNPNVPVQRYDKQVLVPMGEYIPCDFAKKWAAKYGIFDSFTPGEGAKPFNLDPAVQGAKMMQDSESESFPTGAEHSQTVKAAPVGNDYGSEACVSLAPSTVGSRFTSDSSHRIGASICYEETVGNLMRQNSEKGATLLVNLTDDYWFPYSMLAIQHYEHARPRTVENGVPLLRSCNFGISGAIDSLGRTVCAKEGTDEASSFIVTLSSYHYPTLYGKFGDLPILILSLIILTSGLIIVFFRTRK